MTENPYSYPDYKSPYVKSEYTGTFRMKNKETGKMEDVETTRTVYQNTEWDPNLVIPAGTQIGNENVSTEDTTNLERMREGKSPVIEMRDEDGNVTYDKIELHHLTGEEIYKGSEFFTGESRDGTLVEIRASKHDEYSSTIHNLNYKDVSFRTEIVENTDEEGNVVRTREKTGENKHYDLTRKNYWKDRAEDMSNMNDYVDIVAENDTVNYSTEYSNDNSYGME